MCAYSLSDMQRIDPEGGDSKSRRGKKQEGDPLANPKLAEIASNSTPNKAYSPVVLAGLVRLFELGMILASGFAIHRFYVAPRWGLDPAYIFVIPAMYTFFSREKKRDTATTP